MNLLQGFSHFNTYIKSFCMVLLTVLLTPPVKAGPPAAPFLLRVDLLQNPGQVYRNGEKTRHSLTQALAANGQLQFACVNSRFPVFSWVSSAPRQVAYQVLVATREDILARNRADVWDSGRKTSSNSTAVLFGGKALKPSTVYYWKVRIWNSNNKAGAYSAIQSFCTGTNLEDFKLPSFVLEKELQRPLAISKPDGGTILYDFGKDGFAQIRLLVNAERNSDTLMIHLGEMLTPAGHVNSKPPGTVRYRMLKVPLMQGQQVYQPVIPPDKRNTGSNAVLMPADIGEVLPFRYAEVAVLPGKYRVDSVSRYLVTSTFNNGATQFSSSDDSLNKLWDLCKHTVKATTFTGYYVDGDRERIPYEADALINQLSHYATDAEFTMAKRTLDYLIYHPTWPTEWSLQNVLIAWNDYLYSGDLRQAQKLYPELKAKLLTSLARPDGLISTLTGKQTPEVLNAIHYKPFNGNMQLKDIVDWPQPGETDGFVFKDYNALINAWYYAGLQAMGRMAAATGKHADAAFYNTEALKVRQAFQRVFIDKHNHIVLDGEGTTHSSLHANLFALAFGLVPEQNVTHVLSFIHSRGMACSVYAAQFLLDGVSNANDAGYALQLLTDTDKRSWFNMLHEGATMTMEAWGQEYKPNQDWNHAWGTAPANYLVRHFMGIQPLKPGFEQILIKPQPGNVQQATLNHQTIRGVVKMNFYAKPNGFTLNLALPGNTQGLVCLPFASANATVKMDGKATRALYNNGYFEIKNIGAGNHYFEVLKR